MHIASYILGIIGIIGVFVASIFFDTHKTTFCCVFSISVTCSLLSAYFYWRGSTVKANPIITIYLINRHDGYGSRLIIENISNEDAYNINLAFKLKSNQPLPIQQKTYKETFPINIIDGKDRKEISTVIAPDSDRSFNATCNWGNEKGKKFSRENAVNF
jgi:hypothetical protein